jgi:hypothetical protein
MSLLVIIIIVILLFGGVGYVGRGPIYGNPYYTGGYGIVGLILVFVLVLALLGRL